jgi:hypothetical protein
MMDKLWLLHVIEIDLLITMPFIIKIHIRPYLLSLTKLVNRLGCQGPKVR